MDIVCDSPRRTRSYRSTSSLATRLAYSRARPLRLALRRHMGKGRLAVAAQVEEEVEEDRAEDEDEEAARLVEAAW